MKKNIYILLASLFLFSISCDKEEFADLNSNPSTLSEPDLRYSAAKAIEQMYENYYTIWYYNNFQYIFRWSQVTSSKTGNSSNFTEMGPSSYQNIYSGLIPQTMDIRNRIESMSEEDQETYQALKAITYPMQILPAMANTDNTGSLVYTEAGLAPYTSPPLLTPVYDNQEALFNTWLEELDAALVVLSNTDGQLNMGDEDVIYAGDYSKWAKFCNLLKLKIAVRLINIDEAKAIDIAEEVAASDLGYMDELSDDFIYSRGKTFYGNENDDYSNGYASLNLVEFMKDNFDPRLRFIFRKNSFNSEVVQAFIDAEKDLPPYVEEYVNFDTDGNFDSWKAPGEPWVRYYGVPLAPDAQLVSGNDIYFNQSVLYKITLNNVEKEYVASAQYSERIASTHYDYTYPTKPGGRVLELKDNNPALNVILGTAAETNLYFAEFALLGANLPKTAQEYFDWGVELSVRRMDELAEANELPYYSNDPVYTDADESASAATMLQDGEIETLLANSAYDLSTDALEKVHIQQYINFMATPSDVWTVVRRTGIPQKGSSYLPWDEFLVSGNETTIPRRFEIKTPTEDDLNYANKKAAMEEQGFTTGVNTPSILNSERLWMDKNNPNYGAGSQ